MRQWKTIQSGDHPIDNRKKRDILDTIRSLAASYTPEWQFDEEDPDIGSVLALLFAERMQENIRRYNLSLERDYVELMNLLGISPRPASPAHSIALMDLIQNTIPGQMLPGGTKLLAGGEDGIPMVFETSHGIYLTESRLQCMFMVSGITGKIIPLKGRFQPVAYIAGDGESSVEREEDTAFTLFDFSGEGYGKTGLVMYHTHLFDEADNDIWMDIPGACGLADEIVRGNYRLSFYGREGFCPVTDLRMEQDRYLVFRKDTESRKVRLGDEMYSALLLEPVRAVKKNVMASDIRFSASGKPAAAEYVVSGSAEMDAEAFYPFGRAMSLFAELYIGHRYFGNPGARVTLTFELSFEDFVLKWPGEGEDENLKIIKRKPRRDMAQAVAQVYADEVSFSYYNGSGWRKLALERPAESLFKWGEAGACKISFACPADWQDMETGSYAGKCIRLQLLRADHCYYQPAVHHCPVIRQLRIDYSYAHRFVRPQKLMSFQGSRRRDITERLGRSGASPILFESSYHETSLYLGFDRKMEGGPVGLLFRLRENADERGGRLSVTYSTRAGFSKLKWIDHTDGFKHTGSILFMPPADMAKRTIEGQEAYWIRITDEDFALEKGPSRRPVVEEIAVNAAEVDNIETLPEEEYYLDTYGPDMVFPLGAANILQVDVWVNETAGFPDSEMRRFLLEYPSLTRAEYDLRGNIREFYIKWQEVDNFDRSLPGDRHFVVDRINRRLCFGDGVNVRIPQNTEGPAFKTVVRCCDGARANVPAGSINDTMGSVMFVENIHNPVNAFGGMDMESVENALRRGTMMLNSRSRLVSAMDYERETLDFSHAISQVRVVTGVRRDGTMREGSISIAVLMEDYLDGSASFLNLRKRLKEHLLSRCELTVASELLEIVEPLYVEVSVEAWIRTADADDNFEVQQTLVNMLTDYLDPVRNKSLVIGGEVTESQIRLRLNMERGSALIRRILVSGRYRDAEGWHEAELEELSGNPYMLVVSGQHRIRFE